MKSPDCDRPIVTEIASFTPADVARVAHMKPPHMSRGIEFGLGSGNRPISNFPGFQTVFRPLPFTGKQKPRRSVDEILRAYEQSQDKISRIIVKAGTGTDLIALSDVLRGISQISKGRVETVVSSIDPDLLRRIMASENISPDVFQQTLHWVDPKKVRDAIRGIIGNDDFADGAEVSFPLPHISFGDIEEEVDVIAGMLAVCGHNSYIAPVTTQQEVEAAIGVIARANFGAHSRNQSQRVRGFYADSCQNRLNFDVRDANYLGVS